MLSTNCTVEEEILLLLHNAGDTGLSRAEIGKAAMKSASAITRSLKNLCSSAKRQVIKREDDQFSLTPNGIKRVNEEIFEKLLPN